MYLSNKGGEFKPVALIKKGGDQDNFKTQWSMKITYLQSTWQSINKIKAEPKLYQSNSDLFIWIYKLERYVVRTAQAQTMLLS